MSSNSTFREDEEMLTLSNKWKNFLAKNANFKAFFHQLAASNTALFCATLGKLFKNNSKNFVQIQCASDVPLQFLASTEFIETLNDLKNAPIIIFDRSMVLQVEYLQQFLSAAFLIVWGAQMFTISRQAIQAENIAFYSQEKVKLLQEQLIELEVTLEMIDSQMEVLIQEVSDRGTIKQSWRHFDQSANKLNWTIDEVINTFTGIQFEVEEKTFSLQKNSYEFKKLLWLVFGVAAVGVAATGYSIAGVTVPGGVFLAMGGLGLVRAGGCWWSTEEREMAMNEQLKEQVGQIRKNINDLGNIRKNTNRIQEWIYTAFADSNADQVIMDRETSKQFGQQEKPGAFFN